MGVDVISKIHLHGSPSCTILKLTTRQPYHRQRLPVSCNVYECFIIKAFLFAKCLLECLLSTFDYFMSCCQEGEKKGQVHSNIMDLTGKIDFPPSLRCCIGVVRHSGCEKVTDGVGIRMFWRK